MCPFGSEDHEKEVSDLLMELEMLRALCSAVQKKLLSRHGCYECKVSTSCGVPQLPVLCGHAMCWQGVCIS